MRSHQTLRNFLVHPKDKRDPLHTAKTIYEVLCKGCSKPYIGETGRLLKARLADHKAEADKISSKSFIRSQRKASTTETFKSAIAEHVAAKNRAIGWEEAKLIDQEQDKTTRWLKEAIWIRNRGNDSTNKDEGLTNLITSTINSFWNGNPGVMTSLQELTKGIAVPQCRTEGNKVPERNWNISIHEYYINMWI